MMEGTRKAVVVRVSERKGKYAKRGQEGLEHAGP